MSWDGTPLTGLLSIQSFLLIHLHTIKCTSLKGTFWWVLTNLYTQVTTHTLTVKVSNIFHFAKEFIHAPSQLIWSAVCHYRLIFSGVSHEWSYPLCTLSCLVSFSIMLLRSNCVAGCIVSFHCCVGSHYMDSMGIPQLVYPFT